MNLQPAAEIKAGRRFPFGENWLRFLSTLTDDKLAEATHSLQEMLRVQTLQGVSFLDVGSGNERKQSRTEGRANSLPLSFDV